MSNEAPKTLLTGYLYMLKFLDAKYCTQFKDTYHRVRTVFCWPIHRTESRYVWVCSAVFIS